jgi:hypothetical protein
VNKQKQKSKPRSSGFTTAPIQSSASGSTEHVEFLRLPKPGTLDPIYAHSRSSWNALILPCPANDFKPAILSISHRKRGAIRGIRLIVADSAKAYFDALIAEAEQEHGK